MECMNIQINPTLKMPLLVAGIAAVLFSLASVAGMAVSAKSFQGMFASADPSDASSGEAVRTPATRAYRCNGCGVVESIRSLAPKDDQFAAAAPGRPGANGPTRDYAITIRMQDGTMRVITDANPAKWKNGERVQIIAGLGE
jgi:hypothetical protein